ncbi:tRNA (adenosine(37)-N6)-threonylcarbamoyltransferase complex transferase subunit TsaD, partial [Paenibacillus sp. MCAF20]
MSHLEKRTSLGSEDQIILAIETSCDETSVAVIRNGKHILSNVVSSQIDIHERFGGVVPEIASRKHVESITVIRDDAVGEAYDKVARALRLPYPGGPYIDRLASEAEEAVPLPRAWLEADSYDFSFSGLKSAVLAVINQMKMKGLELNEAALARGFQESVIEVLVTKALRAVKQYGAKQLLLCGGVAANRGLRASL